MASCTSTYHQIMDFADVVETRLIDPPRSPLRSYTDDIDEMVKSIRERGLINPIVVRPVGERFEVVAGAIRFEAVKRLRWAKVPCMIRELRDKDAFEVALAENVQRKTMNPLEEAESFRRYIDLYGRGSESALANKLGKSQEYISHRLALLTLPSSIKRSIMRRRISTSVAQELASLEDERLQIEISRQAARDKLTVQDVRRLTRNAMRARPVEFEAGPHDLQGLESLVQPEFMSHGSIRSLGLDIPKRRDLQKAVLLYKLTLMRIGSLIEAMPEDSEVRELLAEQRLVIQNMSNSIIKMKLKVERSGGRY